MEQVVVITAKRTPVGKMGGCFKDVLPEDLLVPVIREVVYSAGLNEEIIDEVIMGQAKPTTDAPNIARVASLKAGLPEDLPAYSVHRQCGSGMQAIASAAWQIRAGYADAIIAGGVESMSTAPYYLRKCRFGYVTGNGELVDPNTESQPKSQPEETYGRFTMGETAENLAEMYAISRKEQDEFAYRSHMRAIRAIDAGRFAEEIVQITIAKSKGAPITVGVDEGPRRDTNLEKLAALKPAFKEGGTVTAGNSSSRNDGAAALLLTSEKKAKEFGL
ncbi:MAG TPA: acetyl-CoA C-acyltransferase, partial [Synergistaceae bacterium]|nr:acetyl-CoA C-acyltransferase [Synergistaceae bacterium]